MKQRVDKEEVGRRLRAMLTWSDSNQSAVSRALQIPSGSVSQYFHGKCNIPSDRMQAIADYFAVDAFDLYYAPRWFPGITRLDELETGGAEKLPDADIRRLIRKICDRSSQTDVARSCGMAISTVARHCAGIHKVSTEAMCRYAAFLEKRPEELFFMAGTATAGAAVSHEQAESPDSETEDIVVGASYFVRMMRNAGIDTDLSAEDFNGSMGIVRLARAEYERLEEAAAEYERLKQDPHFALCSLLDELESLLSGTPELSLPYIEEKIDAALGELDTLDPSRERSQRTAVYRQNMERAVTDIVERYKKNA